MPKYRRGSGIIYMKRGWCYIKYYVKGKPVYEATRTKNRAEARRILQSRLGQVADGRYLGPSVERVTFEQLSEYLLNDYEVNVKRSLPMVKGKINNHLAPFFGGKTAHSIDASLVQEFVKKRLTEGAANAEINRELSALKRMFNLGLRMEKIARKPYIPKLDEDNVREGFFERWEFEAILAKLPTFLHPSMTFAYYTGWRVRAEIHALLWRRVDFEAQTITLPRGTTKNKKGKVLKIPNVLWTLIETQWQEHTERYSECPYVFNRDGREIKYYRRPWVRACQEAGIQRMPHDFRRTAARNLVRAGIPERVAMEITGHKTRSVFDRYNIVSMADLDEAARKIDERIARQGADHAEESTGAPTDRSPSPVKEVLLS